MKPTRRWFQYSLRSLLVILTALAVWLGVVVNRAREQREAVGAIEAAGGAVYFDWEFEPDRKPHGPVWLRKIIGDDYFQRATSVCFARLFAETPDGKIEVVPYLRDVDIEALIPSLRRLRRLESISTFSNVSNATILELEEALPGVAIQNDG